MPIVVVILMLALILPLAGYAAYLLVMLARQRKKQAQQQQLVQSRMTAKQIDHQNSINIIARCLLQGQVTLTEAAIRISTLARAMNPALLEQQYYLPFDQLARATAHIPILDNWRQLSKEQKRKLSAEREEIEQTHKRQVLDAAERLILQQ